MIEREVVCRWVAPVQGGKPDLSTSHPGQQPKPTVALVLQETARPLETSAFWEVFGAREHRIEGMPSFDLRFVSANPHTPVPLFGGAAVTPTEGLDFASTADLVVVVPPLDVPRQPIRALAAALKSALASGASILTVDSGVFLLAEAGLLNGVDTTTHWRLADQFRRRYPHANLMADRLYVDSAPIFTASGAAAALDVSLHVVGKYYGVATASRLAERMQTGLYRNGDHRQLVKRTARQLSRDDGIVELLDWAMENLHEDLSVDLFAKRTFMSGRSLTRRFRAATGATPYAWVLTQRMRRAQELLEDGREFTVEDVAIQAGFGSAGILRQHFQRLLGCSPTDYRRRYSAASLTDGRRFAALS